MHSRLGGSVATMALIRSWSYDASTLGVIRRLNDRLPRVHTAALHGLYDELEDVSMKTAHHEQATQERREQQMAAGLSIYKVATQCRRNALEMTSLNFMNDANGNRLVNDGDISNRWKKYSENFLNEEYPRTDFYDVEPHEEKTLDITIEEVEAG